MKPAKIPEKAVTRLSIYLRCLEELTAEGAVSVSSRELAERFGLNSAQVRKDLAYFGQFGVRGLGYYIAELTHNLERILGLKQDWQVALVGVGNLGSALLAYKGFQARGFKLTVAFDTDPGKDGQVVGGITIQGMASLVPTLRRLKVKIALLTVPAPAAQSVADLLVEAGVTAILNFAPTQLTVSESVKVQYVDLSVLLKTLTYHTVHARLAKPEPRFPGRA
ncbi:MAG TPA: redox-sensing transcriptional repressor Rex [Candidatus Baltobacteraceae bacterium]|nr:redox-sensing transcriptional repressor Rex [Candidatus Baltobacteraceae bacterium]